MKADIPILYVGQLERWRSDLRGKLLVLVVFVFVDLDGRVLQLVLLTNGQCAAEKPARSKGVLFWVFKVLRVFRGV